MIDQSVEKINLNGYPLNLQILQIGNSIIKKIWGDDTLSGKDVLYLFKTQDGQYSAIINFFNSKKVCKQADFKVPTQLFFPPKSRFIADDLYIFNTWVRKHVPDYGTKALLTIHATQEHIERLKRIYKIMFLGNPGVSMERKFFGRTLSTHDGTYMDSIIEADEETLLEFAGNIINFVPLDQKEYVDILEGGAKLQFDGSNYYIKDNNTIHTLSVDPEEQDEYRRIQNLITKSTHSKHEQNGHFKSIVVGSGSALTDEKMTNCYLLKPCGGSSLIIDPVHNPIETMLAVGEDSTNINDVIVTHIHGDHDTGGVIDLIKFRHYYNERNASQSNLKFITTPSLLDVWLEKNSLIYEFTKEEFRRHLEDSFHVEFTYIETKAQLLRGDPRLFSAWLDYTSETRFITVDILEDDIFEDSKEVLYSLFLQERSNQQFFNFDLFDPPIKSKLELQNKTIEFRYNLHPTKTVGVKVIIKPEYTSINQPISIAYSGDTLYDPIKINEIFDSEIERIKSEYHVLNMSAREAKGQLGECTYRELLCQLVANELEREDLKGFIWDADCVYHETGIPPLHTDAQALLRLSDTIKENIQWVHGDNSIGDWSSWSPKP